MNDLSNQSTVPPVRPSQPPAQPVSAVSAGNKEVVGGAASPELGLRDATGAEVELPKEVVSAGVRIQPTSIPIPQSVASLGVKPAGQNVPVQTAPAVVLPLSDDQIAAGLHANITDSIRWLAEWCVLRLKHLHIAIKDIHGKLVRVKES